ncbi:BRCA2, helical [Musa troglodytarum]|uniref:BRCA2, helical n=1 Tax=Musa troglodytarum TaxID=320322 RepID=A0A9E7K8E1_9LILI|nr:BRCA2, helical [Musa troglodytarum]
MEYHDVYRDAGICFISSKLPRVTMVAVEMEKGFDVSDGNGESSFGIETTSGGQDDRFPLFRTGSGKSVTIKESSLRKAAAVLEGNGINKDEVFPMFSTGSGKLVTVKESSIRKAAAIFIGENMEKAGGIALKHVVRDVIMEVGFHCHATSAHMMEALALFEGFKQARRRCLQHFGVYSDSIQIIAAQDENHKEL